MSWEIGEGEVLTRREVHRRYQGQQQGGIATPEGPHILLFAGKKGERYGYKDGPQPDGSYRYTGQGRDGDQKFSRGNSAILRHREHGKALRLFEEAGESKVRYLGSYLLDEQRPYCLEDAPDESKNIRSVIVFRLLQADATVEEVELPGSVVVDDDLEAHNVENFSVNHANPPTKAERREAALVGRYALWLTSRGHVVKQRKMKSPAHAAFLRVDLLDSTTGEIVEAKGSIARPYIRLAIGQILDYGRYAEAERRAILLPSRPADDMIDLLKALAISCIFEVKKGMFARIEAAATLCEICPLLV